MPQIINEEFKYIRERYKVPAEINREVIVDGKKGIITKDIGNYIGVNFYDNPKVTFPCHPTWHVQYLGINNTPPIKRLTRSQRRYQAFLEADSDLSFREWLDIKI